MKIFAVVPVYNVEPYIDDFLKSLYEQEAKNIEYILIDDGSKDKSGHICDYYSIKDPRIRVIHTHNCGVSHARNVGLQVVERNASDSDYVVFFDPDDYLTTPKAITEIALRLKQLSPDLLLYNYSVNNKLIINAIRSVGGVICGLDIGKKLFPNILLGEKQNGIVLTASLFRGAFSVKVINKYNLRFREDIRKSEDTLFYARFLTLIDKVILSDIVPYNYRIRPDSLTTTYRYPSKLGIEKGLSIISDFNYWAGQCKGLEKNKITNYFNYRYVGIVINYVLSLTDFRSKLSISEIRDRLNELYSYRELVEKIDNINSLSEYSITQRVRILLVRRRIGLIAYGKVFHLLKWIKHKIR